MRMYLTQMGILSRLNGFKNGSEFCQWLANTLREDVEVCYKYTNKKPTIFKPSSQG